MKVLFVGGTGNISTAAARLAIERGIELTILTRGTRKTSMLGARTVQASIENEAAVFGALGAAKFDAVVDWIAYKPADIERDLRLFRGRTAQYVFISSASCYKKPPDHYIATENTPLSNPYSDYSQQKIACEERLLEAYADGFPITIVRPSLTYGDTSIPLPTNSAIPFSYTIVNRMRLGKKVVIPGDGTSLWVLTHNSDFSKGLIGLLGNPAAIGEAYHITSDEVLTWNQIYAEVAAAAGVGGNFVHIASDLISAWIPEKMGSLLGDKSHSVVFDNSKIKSTVQDCMATVPFAEGIRRTIAWFDSDKANRIVDANGDARWDALVAGYESLGR
jgi:nucleoside-diphosphate-sugar epimerase